MDLGRVLNPRGFHFKIFNQLYLQRPYFHSRLHSEVLGDMNLWVEGTPFNSRHTHLLRSKRQYTHSPKEERGPLFLSIYVSAPQKCSGVSSGHVTSPGQATGSRKVGILIGPPRPHSCLYWRKRVHVTDSLTLGWSPHTCNEGKVPTGRNAG